MPRIIRIEFPGAYYHIIVRGHCGESIFRDDEDRHFFLKSLGEACEKTGWKVHSWVLMSNHYHLLVETPEANLVDGMQWLQNLYTHRFNSRHKTRGRLFADRYKAVSVQSTSGNYYELLLDYIHLNPVRAGLVKPEERQSVLDYPWSSVAGGYALPGNKRPKWLETASGLAAFACPDTAAGRKLFVKRLDKRAAGEEATNCGVPEEPEGKDKRLSDLRRGWYWGSKAFSEKLLKIKAKMPKKERPNPAPPKKKLPGLEVAKEILRLGLAAAGLKKRDLSRLPGSDPRKAALAMLIWNQTTMSQTWLAEELVMKSAANVSQAMHRWKQNPLTDELPPKLLTFLLECAAITA